jgi:hypothetical protein
MSNLRIYASTEDVLAHFSAELELSYIPLAYNRQISVI